MQQRPPAGIDISAKVFEGGVSPMRNAYEAVEHARAELWTTQQSVEARRQQLHVFQKQIAVLVQETRHASRADVALETERRDLADQQQNCKYKMRCASKRQYAKAFALARALAVYEALYRLAVPIVRSPTP